jgi:5-methyltetrahydrofolate--homocysteine methyltransferase
MIIIGESLNAAIPAVGAAISQRDDDFISELARLQQKHGADFLDVNAGGLPGRDEVEDLQWLVRVVNQASELPLTMDSNNPKALATALIAYDGPRPILSSISGEKGRVEGVLSLAVENDCAIVALCIDENGIPPTAEGRLAIAEGLIDQATAAGMQQEDIYIDPLVMTVSADHTAGRVTLDTLGMLRAKFSEVKTVCGLSNIGFGLPRRHTINRSFAAMLTYLGMEAFIMDVRDQELVNTLYVSGAVAGNDPYCRNFLTAYRAGKLGPK